MINQLKPKQLLPILAITLWVAGCAKLAYQHMNDPERDVWQMPQAVITLLDIKPGTRVADLGAGGGYFTWRLAEAVGGQGKVYAVDIDDTSLELLKTDSKARGLANVITVRAEPTDAKLPESVDLALVCDTYHHLQNRVAYFRSLQRYLKPDARVAILDFYPHGFFSGVLGHGVEKADVQREMELAGYKLLADHNLIDRQFFLVFSRTDGTWK